MFIPPEFVEREKRNQRFSLRWIPTILGRGRVSDNRFDLMLTALTWGWGVGNFYLLSCACMSMLSCIYNVYGSVQHTVVVYVRECIWAAVMRLGLIRHFWRTLPLELEVISPQSGWREERGARLMLQYWRLSGGGGGEVPFWVVQRNSTEIACLGPQKTTNVFNWMHQFFKWKVGFWQWCNASDSFDFNNHSCSSN